ncbi:hypothetical protein MHM98_09870 [Psychrobium sp. MM17-31]|uniref:hypothetical protein n=1 Tax=Psychrobium sp. MM17-31 TaxID=2917758 RepID=UPI001EF6510C|nr:hypothetical protein [Psychrobium sp. MM17-31]MCG7531647.1 hypothetical protein [Psychrobium sp. MM17-31]
MTKSNSQPISFVAVLTGDIVKSRQIEQAIYDDLLYSLNNVLAYVSQQHGDNAFQFIRGDSFQLVVHDVEQALKYALLIRLACKELEETLDCRISIGISGNDVLRHQIGNSTGDAFTLSGQGLDTLKDDRLLLRAFDKNFNRHIALLIQYVDHQMSQLTQRQAAIFQLKIRDPELIQQQIADLLGAQRVSISRSLKTARYDLLAQAIDHVSREIGGLTNG